MSYRPEAGAGVADVDLSGRVALVTGSTDGIGRQTALALGRLGATVLVHGRDREKGRAVVSELRGTDADGAALLLADFADREAVEHLAARVRERVDRLDVLVNNAGAWLEEGTLAWNGVEATFAINHLAPFLLTTRLLGPLRATGGRVVTVASELHRKGSLDLDDLGSLTGYDGRDAYARSKLANVTFTLDLADRCRAVTANCLHPGTVPETSLSRDAPVYSRLVYQAIGAIAGIANGEFTGRVARGATTSVYLAAAPDLDADGAYFVGRIPVTPAAPARDPDRRRRLRTVSADLAGVDEDALVAGTGPGDQVDG